MTLSRINTRDDTLAYQYYFSKPSEGDGVTLIILFRSFSSRSFNMIHVLHQAGDDNTSASQLQIMLTCESRTCPSDSKTLAP